jgi:UDP-N-acetylmuramyl pentapeptide phosphotransferase/UDP-N-acetylglucosamine-1-phosphate transferase
MNIQPYENIFMTLITLFVSVIVIYYLIIKHRERMEMIRMQQIPDEEDPEQRKRSVLGKAIMMLALGIGLAIGMCLADSYRNLPALILYLVTVLLFGGIGLLIYYLILRKAK